MELFLKYANDAGNWSGTPLFGGNFKVTKADCGHLTYLKKLGLVETFIDRKEEWIQFTDKGKDLAIEHGVNELEFL